MRRIVADTMVLRYLILIDAVHILPALFDQVIIPPEVANELQRPRTPEPVRAWMMTPPPWLTVRQPSLSSDPALRRLGTGEHETILLMQEAAAMLLVPDDHSAYRAALARAIPVVRTLRVLEIAAERALVDLPTAITRLRDTGFYMPEDRVIDELLAHDTERKRQQRQSQEEG
jgi:predicted nucleic acid-binding protein